jgi:hypothetical protein
LLMSYSFQRGARFITCSTYLASKRQWENSSAHQRSFPHRMRRDSWSWFRRRYWSL